MYYHLPKELLPAFFHTAFPRKAGPPANFALSGKRKNRTKPLFSNTSIYFDDNSTQTKNTRREKRRSEAESKPDQNLSPCLSNTGKQKHPTKPTNQNPNSNSGQIQLFQRMVWESHTSPKQRILVSLRMGIRSGNSQKSCCHAACRIWYVLGSVNLSRIELRPTHLHPILPNQIFCNKLVFGLACVYIYCFIQER